MIHNDAPLRRVSMVEGSQGTSARVETTLLLAEFAVEPGDRVVCVGNITDAFENNGSPRPAVVSSLPGVSGDFRQ